MPNGVAKADKWRTQVFGLSGGSPRVGLENAVRRERMAVVRQVAEALVWTLSIIDLDRLQPAFR